jgi:hypothetical protein
VFFGVGGGGVFSLSADGVNVTLASGKKLQVDSSNSLTTVSLQINGDPNTGIGQIGGADTLSAVTAGGEAWRATSTSTNMSRRFACAKGADVAAAGTLTLGTDGNFFSITGNTNIDFLTTSNWQAGSIVLLQFTGTPTVNHNTGSPPGSTAAILLAGAAGFAATANDTLSLVYNGTTWVEVARTVI